MAGRQTPDGVTTNSPPGGPGPCHPFLFRHYPAWPGNPV